MKHFESNRLRRVGRWLRRTLIAFAAVSVVLWVIWLCLPKPELFPADLSFSRQVFDRAGRLLHIRLAADEKYRLPIRFEDLSPHLIAATLAKEDRRYFAHGGVDFRSLARAGWGVMSGQSLGGGSTLTMQYARLRWKLHTRSWWGKMAQIFRATQLERHYGKRELLEAYLTLAPYGGNVEGISAASILWCGKLPAELTEREAICLSVIPQSPATRRPGVAPPRASLLAAQARLYTQLRGACSDLDARYSVVPMARPMAAPHLARRLSRRTPMSGDISTTIDLRAQDVAQTSIADFRERWQGRGLTNAAALLVHAPTREVRAYVGSASFTDVDISGQVDGVAARRSPGSALKPFVYALALDSGLIHPGSLLDDAPRAFSSYNPENSDRGFLGPIPASEALRRSRNVPFVDLLARLPGGGLDRFLRNSGVSLLHPPGAYGLSLALGGAEVSLEELAVLYSALATDGQSKPLRYTVDSTESDSRASTPLSAAARYLTVDALRDRSSGAPEGLAWKTGTSHGFRDAWACGVQGDWVICVWVGHFNGRPMPGLFARETAAPLLFDMVRRLGLPAKAVVPPDTVATVTLCSISGLLCTPQCPHATQRPFIAGVSPIGVCDVHREIFVNAQGAQVSHSDPTGHREVREFWPRHRLEQFRRAGLPKLPPPMAAREIAVSGAPPRIVTPQPTLTYVVRSGDPDSHRIPLEAQAEAGTRRIHWFANSQYLGASAPSEPLLWQASPGRWTLQATDDVGRCARVSIHVSNLP